MASPLASTPAIIIPNIDGMYSDCSSPHSRLGPAPVLPPSHYVSAPPPPPPAPSFSLDVHKRDPRGSSLTHIASSCASDTMLHGTSLTVPDSRPSTIHELDLAARQHFDVVAPSSNLQLRDCLRCAEGYLTQADSLTKLMMGTTVDDDESGLGNHNNNDQGGSISSSSTGDVQVDLERGYISYARARILIEKIYRHPNLHAEFTEKEWVDLAVDLKAIHGRLNLLNHALVDRLARSPHTGDPSGAIPAFQAADQRDAERQAQRAPTPGSLDAPIVGNNWRCVIS
ncbi:hypothetical protein B0H19DRAFT_1285461 [Mycena capillaripes]|nr:hypothetical protein B0H19DRAFT_1285461 [Mycena capillaripes]